MRKCVLTWAKLTNNITTFGNPNVQERIKNGKEELRMNALLSLNTHTQAGKHNYG